MVAPEPLALSEPLNTAYSEGAAPGTSMHIFFDLDGTLTNPHKGIIACIRHALSTLDRASPSDAELTRWIGPPLQESFQALLGCPDRAAEAVQRYRDRFATVGLFENEVYAGIPSMLDTLAQEHTLWVTTSKPQIFAQRIVEHFGLQPCLAGVYGSELDGTRAQKTDLLAHVLQTEAIDPQTTLMVGDRHYDMRGARQNSITAIGVTWGFGSAAELQAAGAAALCDQPRQLPELVAQLAA